MTGDPDFGDGYNWFHDDLVDGVEDARPDFPGIVRHWSRWNREITTFLYGSVKGRRWRLDDRNDGPNGVEKGSLRDRKVPIGVGVQWRFAKAWRLRTDMGVTVYRQLKVTDDDNDEVDSDTMKAPGVFGSLMLQARF